MSAAGIKQDELGHFAIAESKGEINVYKAL